MIDELGGIVGHVVVDHLFNVVKFELDVSDVPVVNGSARDVDEVGSEYWQATLGEDTIGANGAPFKISKLS